MTGVTVYNELHRSIVQLMLLQHGYCTFVIILFGPFTRLFINLTMCIQALFPKSATTLGLVEQAFWRMPFFTECIGAGSFEVILAGQSKHSSAGTFASGASGSRCIFHTLLRRRIRRHIRLCRFSTHIHIVTDTTSVSFRHCVGFPLPTISKNSLSTLFCPLILDHGVLLHFWPQNSYFEFPARYFSSPLFSICDNQVQLSSGESPGHTIPIRS